jgi:hypothetical protein
MTRTRPTRRHSDALVRIVFTLLAAAAGCAGSDATDGPDISAP